MNAPLNCTCVSGSRRGSGEELGSHGLHLCRLSAIPHLGVSGGVEHGEPGGDLACSHRRVSPLSAFVDTGAFVLFCKVHFCQILLIEKPQTAL